MRPPLLCIYCGHERTGDDPSVRCARCGHAADGVRWWLREGGGRDPSGVVLGALLAVVLGGFLASVCVRAAFDPLTTGFVAGVAALLLAPVLRALLRRAPTAWSFATLDGERIGEAICEGAALRWAFGVRVRDRGVDVPAYAAVIDASTARAAGVRALGPGVCLALRIDEGAYDDQFPERALSPIVTAAVVGIAARGGCSLAWQRGWSRSALGASPVSAYQRLVLTASAAPGESRWLERRLLSAIERAEAENVAAWTIPESVTRGDAHYRAPATVALPRFCSLDDLARELFEDAPLREDFDANVAPDDARADEAAIAFRAFTGAEPEVVQQLIDTVVDV